MSRFNFDIEDLISDNALRTRALEEIHKDFPDKLRTSRMTEDDPNPMSVTLFNLSEVLMGAPAFNSMQDVLALYESTVTSSIATIWNEVPDLLKNFVPGDIRAILNRIGLDPVPDEQDGATGGASDTSGELPPLQGGRLGPASKKPFSTHRLQRKTIRGAQAARDVGFDGVIGGWRQNARDRNGHPAGLAIDLMTDRLGQSTPRGRQKGEWLTQWYIQNADHFDLLYVYWNKHTYSRSRNFRPRRQSNRGSITADHMDHPHVQFRR